ncbi:MAG: protease inhibitor I42 family protein [Verrucomicrobia bacterium]|nr:protease inhibitor I42 family protein [Verrucomicrobiota bacterium]
MKSTIAIFILAVSLISCHDSSKNSVTEGTQEVTVEGVLRAKAGETFIIKLKANHTTGYSWALSGQEDPSLVEKVSNDYLNDPHEPGMVGVGGVEHWTFRALKKGTIVLSFNYGRPWEKNTEPSMKQAFKVIIE